jgi:hypothetical protein
MTSRTIRWRGALALTILLGCLLASPAAGQQEPPAPKAPSAGADQQAPPPRLSAIMGTVLDAVGQPVLGCRVVARQADGVEAFVSRPSDEEGRYTLSVPEGKAYLLVAVITESGGRMALPETDALRVGSEDIRLDVQLPLALGPTPRKNGVDTGGAERLFLSFVEDPALVEDPYLEGRIDYASFGSADTFGLGLIFAHQFRSIPRIEWGLRGGFARVNLDRGSDGSGTRDLEAWGKFAFHQSADHRTNLAFGALLTFPTGDQQSGLGRDALQSKLFFTASYAFRDLALVGSAGFRVTGNGMVGDIPLEGNVSGIAAIGVLLPLWHNITLTTELDYQSERFDGFGEESRVAFGIDWRILPRGVIRAAAIGGLVDDSADARIVAGFGWSF